MRLVALLLLVACSGTTIEARPGDTAEPDGPFELDVPDQTLRGQIYEESWGPVVDAFAIDDGDGAYRILAAPFPLTACDAGQQYDPGVLFASVPSLGEEAWGDGSEVTLAVEGSEGVAATLISAKGGGYRLRLDPAETTVVGALLFDVDPSTRLAGSIEAPVCQ